MIVIVSGTRWATEEHRSDIGPHLFGYGLGPDITLVHGAAKGVDRVADGIAREFGWLLDPMAADWDRCAPDVPQELGGCPPRPHLRTRNGRTYCPQAGPRRNQRMVARLPRADVAVCFPAIGCRGRSGTWDLAHRAADAGIEVHVFPLRVDVPAAAVPLPIPTSAEEA